ncbi:MAG: hypothetical protein ACI87E_001295 [Mariniblastus sp.]|jgi:hypothetical protein
MAKLAPSILALKTSIRVEDGEPLAPRPNLLSSGIRRTFDEVTMRIRPNSRGEGVNT